MRAMHGVRAFRLLSVFGAFVVFATAANADTSSERPGSILIFPKVVRTSTRDTVIQITNTGNLVNELRCFYLDGDTCGGVDFDLTLTKQQPIHWRVSTGRAVNPLDPFNTDGSGLDPGLIPPVGPDFAGALVCVEAADGVPTAQNKIKGEAALQDVSGSATANDSKYNAVAISGVTVANDAAPNDLALGTEYGECSTVHQLDVKTGVPAGDLALGSTGSVVTNVTVVPCDLDFRRNRQTNVTINARAWTETEEEFSPDVPAISCWGTFEVDLSGLLPQTPFATVEYTSDRPVVMVAEEFVTDSNPIAGPSTASAARNVHLRADATEPSVIKLPNLPQ